MAVIGVKLADGTFYPVLKEGVPAKKMLCLTTVSDGQAVAHIELFCSEDGTMNAARYIDTLLLERVAPQRSGEPDIVLAVSVDERNVFRVEARDSEFGSTSAVQALLSPFAAFPDAAPRAALPASPPKIPAKRAVSEKPKKNEMSFVVGGICVLCVTALLLLLFCFVRSQNA
ncbi:Hsp70 family protein [Treponema endosymbiont of Eucomonympha sp.]|uniref:Hsp70 family protein n=1 Tax=Treponema endosymbiont of Eucomonympha sp. TaxID=1580831 RepID=UPI0007862E24|nr:Hsp70 family protein [Treponema endosymbiont of Eucomonympha sp.]